MKKRLILSEFQYFLELTKCLDFSNVKKTMKISRNPFSKFSSPRNEEPSMLNFLPREPIPINSNSREAISFWWRFSRTRDDEQERLFESAMEQTAFLRITKECR